MSAEPEAQPPTRRHWATLTIVVVNVTVALAMFLAGINPFFASAGQLIDAGAVDATSVWHGDVWRLVTACFVHVGVWHLGLNMFAMLQVGRVLESLVGGARTALVYFVSGVFGFAASVVLQPHITTGASGAVFGVVGALLALARLIRNRRLGKLIVTALVPFVGATILLGVLVPNIDNTAHVAGLLMGFLLAYGLHAGETAPAHAPSSTVPGAAAATTREHAPRGSRVLGILALVACAVLFLGATAYAARPVASPRYHAVEGLLALQRGKIGLAKEHLARASRLGATDVETLVLAGRIAEDAGDVAQADALLSEALVRLDEKDPTTALELAQRELMLVGGDDPQLPYTDARTVWALCRNALALAGDRRAPSLKNNCGWLRLRSADPRVRDPQHALALARAAVKENEKEPMFVHTLACALAETGDPQEGLALLEKLAVGGLADDIGGGLTLTGERARLKRMAESRVSPEAPASALP